jgi:uncharacterized protein
VTAARERLLAWRGLDAWRAELAEVSLHGDRLLARGTQLGVDPLPYRLEYSLDTATDFVTSSLTVDVRGSGWLRRLDLLRHDDGAWHASGDARGEPGLPPVGGELSDLMGARDCDLAFSPLTNAMPILREGLLGGGGPVDLVMAWVSVPDLAVHRSEQRYEPVDAATVRYVDPSFTAELELDAEGLVVRYPGLAERVSP